MTSFARRIRPHVDAELDKARQCESQNQAEQAFHHLENAHVLGQDSTWHHTRVHLRMWLWGLRHGRIRELLGQIPRIVGALTKTVFGLNPAGNTWGSNVSPFKPMPVPESLRKIIEAARSQGN